jgi:uncharacterized protein (TIGR03083 family)
MSDPRPLFSEAARTLLALVRSIEPDEWEIPGLGEWNLRELVAHTGRAFTTIEDYLGGSGDETITNPSDYYRIALALPDIHASVAERGHLAGAQIGDDPAAAVAELVDRVVPLIDATPLTAVLDVRGGRMTLATYLPTRVLELVVHTDDICRARGRAPVASAPLVRECGSILAGMYDAEHITVIRALLGRGAYDGTDLFTRP